MNESTPEKTENLSVNAEIPIPEFPSVVGWKEIPIVETDKSREPLVPLGIFSDHRGIFTSSAYAGQHWNSPYIGGLEGSTMALFVREGVASRLEAVEDHLPRGYHLMAMDTHRSLEVQGALYKQYEMPLRAQHPDWSDDEIAAETQKYVSLPSNNPSRPSPHNTGAAVDVVLIRLPDNIQAGIERLDDDFKATPDENWQKQYELGMMRDSVIRRYAEMPNFGTRFDHGGPEAALRYYEELEAQRQLSQEEIEARDNRRILYHSMIKAGFMPYEDEWWHFNDPASQMGAKVAQNNFAEYGAAELSPENLEFERVREIHHKNTSLLASGIRWTVSDELQGPYDLAVRMSDKNNPRALGNVVSMFDARIRPPKR